MIKVAMPICNMLFFLELGTEPEHQRNFTCKRAPVSTITAMFYTETRFHVKFKVKFLIN